MKKIAIYLNVVVGLFACNTDEEPFLLVDQPSQDGDYILFGNYAGFCQGEECIEIFKLTSASLSEDQSDNYPNPNIASLEA
jgi:hypothetical protein